MLTGGLGYTYGLTATPPLTQTNVPGYPFTATNGQGGLIVPAANVWKVATGFTGRRAIVETARCNNCHDGLGVAPTFHAGQRNDGPTCSFCHTPNRTSSGWSAGSKYFIHAIHSGRKRVNPFTWHAAAAGLGYGEVEFPAPLNECTNCHVPGAYDFTASASLAALPNWTVTTAASGGYSEASPTSFTFSPYVTLDTTAGKACLVNTDCLSNNCDAVTGLCTTANTYGSGFSFNAGTAVTTPAAGTTLVISPVTTVCSACHDSSGAIAHMKQNGGSFYAPRSATIDAAGQTTEQCMICHGPGRVAAIGIAHWQ
jgi:OmcA/MtrC family decaheme c-type cytochrome